MIFNRPRRRSEYTILEYLESTGAECIDTGFKADNNTILEVTFNSAAKSGVVAGADSGYKSKSLMIAMTVVSIYGTSKNVSISANAKHTMRLGPRNYVLDGGNPVVVLTNQYGWSGEYPIYLFGNNRKGAFSEGIPCKIYSAKITDSDGSVWRNFVPVRNRAGVRGMLDTAHNEFYPLRAGAPTWKLNPLLVINKSTVFNNSFESNGKTFSAMELAYPEGSIYFYDSSTATSTLAYSDQNGTNWVDEAYRTVKFAKEPASDQLAWLTKNGTRL